MEWRGEGVVWVVIGERVGTDEKSLKVNGAEREVGEVVFRGVG